jgi:hypothetical protein
MESTDKRRQAIREHRKWLENFGWALYVRLKIRTRAITDAEMKELFHEWISEVQRLHGSTDFRWVYVLEPGATLGKRHFHVLIGGLRNRRVDLASRWSVIGGDSLVDRYDSDKGGILSMLKTMDDEGRLEIDFKLPVIPGVGAPESTAKRPRRITFDLDDDVSPADLRSLFSRYGTVSDVRIHSSLRYRFALVDMPCGGTDRAMEYLNWTRWRGRQLRIEPGTGLGIESDFDGDSDH